MTLTLSEDDRARLHVEGGLLVMKPVMVNGKWERRPYILTRTETGLRERPVGRNEQ